MKYLLLMTMAIWGTSVLAQNATYNFNFVQPTQTGSVENVAPKAEVSQPLVEVQQEKKMDFDLSSGLRLSSGVETHSGQRGLLTTNMITVIMNTSEENDFFIGFGKSSYHGLEGGILNIGLQRITDSGFKLFNIPVTLTRFIKASVLSSDHVAEDGIMNKSLNSYDLSTLAFGLTPEIRYKNIAALGFALDVSYGSFSEEIDGKESSKNNGLGVGLSIFLTARI